MQIVHPGSFVTLHYRLQGPDGDVLVDTFGGTPATLTLGQGQLAPGIEARLVGMVEGQRERLVLAAGEAFGPRQPSLLQLVSRSLLATLGNPDEHYQVGDVLDFPMPHGQGRYAGVVRALGSDALTMDFNHPLAGQPVTFEVELIGVDG